MTTSFLEAQVQFQFKTQKLSQTISAPHIDSGSQFSPSLLHHNNGIAATIQFHQGINGLTHEGIAFQTTSAGHPKQTVVHIAPVKVGETLILTKFEAEYVHNRHPAHNVHGASYANGDGGHIAGHQTGQ